MNWPTPLNRSWLVSVPATAKAATPPWTVLLSVPTEYVGELVPTIAHPVGIPGCKLSTLGSVDFVAEHAPMKTASPIPVTAARGARFIMGTSVGYEGCSELAYAVLHTI